VLRSLGDYFVQLAESHLSHQGRAAGGADA